MANSKLLFACALIFSLCVVYSMPRAMDLLRTKSRTVNLSFDEYGNEGFVRIKKAMITDDKCPKGMIYHFKQCRYLDEYERQKNKEDYEDNDFTTNTVTHKTSKQFKEEKDVTIDASTSTEPDVWKDKHLPSTANAYNYITGESTTASSDVDSGTNTLDTGTETVALEEKHLLNTEESYDIVTEMESTTVSSHVDSGADTSGNKTNLLITFFILSMAVLLVWPLRNLYYRHYRRRNEIERDAASVPEQQFPMKMNSYLYKIVPSMKETSDTTKSSYLQTSPLV